MRQRAVLELDRGEIDRNSQVTGPARSVRAGLPQHPFADRHDEPRLLRERDELAGRNDAPLRMIPAQQGLEAACLVALDVDDWLVVEFELAIAELWVRVDVPAPGDHILLDAVGVRADRVVEQRDGVGCVHRESLQSR